MNSQRRYFLMSWEEFRPGFSAKGRSKFFRRNLKTKNVNVSVYPNGGDGSWRWRIFLATGHQLSGTEKSLQQAQKKADEVAIEHGYKIVDQKIIDLWT